MSSFRRVWWPVATVVLTLVGLSTWLALDYRYTIRSLQEIYRDEQIHKAQQISKDLESAFKEFYQGLRMISLLPGVRSVDRYGKNLELNTRKAIQQIYNNTFLNVGLSEIYILPSDLNPHRIDPISKKLEAPIMSFDELIVDGAQKPEVQKAADRELEEVEIFEYEEMSKHLKLLKAEAITSSQIANLDIPGIISRPIITCDNSEFTIEHLKSKNDEARMGIVYTVPIYGLRGEFRGGVAGVIRTRKIQNFIPDQYYMLSNERLGIRLARNPVEELSNEFPNIIANYHSDLKIRDISQWELKAAWPDEIFWTSSGVKNANRQATTSGFLVILVVAIMGFLMHRLVRYQEDLADQVEARTKELEFQKDLLVATQQALEERQKALYQNSKMAALGEMAAGIAHEINNPLTIIMGRVSLMITSIKEKRYTEEELERWLLKINDTAERIAKIILGLRTFARGGQHDPLQETNVKQILNDSISLCAELLKSQELSLEIPVIREDLTINCRPVQISQVIMNLISNAKDAVLHSPKKEISVEVNVVNSEIEIAVSDSGPGIPDSIRDRILEPFFTTKEIGKGTGLGLSISKSIIEGHGGRLEIDRRDERTRFSIFLPSARPIASEKKGPSSGRAF